MSRPVLLVSVLLILVITSQFEWRQQLVSDADPTPNESQKQQQITHGEEGVKEKIILSQEKSIQRLNELVRVLKNSCNSARAIAKHPMELSARKWLRLSSSSRCNSEILSCNREVYHCLCLCCVILYFSSSLII